jgi:dihydrofolate reductase
MRLTLTMFLTLDGIGEDCSGGFEQGGWRVPHVDQDFMQIVTAWFENADAFLFGRRTYEIFAGYWPRVTDPNNVIAAKLNALPKYVASRTLKKLDWCNATLMSDVVAEVEKLKEQEGRELQVHGGGELAQVLIVNNLIDEYRLCIHPVVLGNGRRVFLEGALASCLHLLDGRRTSTGVTINSHDIFRVNRRSATL